MIQEYESTLNFLLNNVHPGKYFKDYKSFLNEIYENPIDMEYINFAPGGNYIIPKYQILKYNIEFFKKIREYVGWDIRPGEAFLLERLIPTVFNGNLKIKDKYVNK